MFGQIKIYAKSCLSGYILKGIFGLFSSFFVRFITIIAVIIFGALIVYPPLFELLWNKTKNPYAAVGFYLAGLFLIFCLCLFHSSIRIWSENTFFVRATRNTKRKLWNDYFRLRKSVVSLFLLCGILSLKIMWLILFLVPFIATSIFICVSVIGGGVAQNVLWVYIFACILLLVSGLFFWFCTIQRYFLSLYLYSENEKTSAIDTISKSIEIMNGLCIKTALFKISLFPWYLLCLLVLPCIYIYPYCKMSCAVLASEYLEFMLPENSIPIILGL